MRIGGEDKLRLRPSYFLILITSGFILTALLCPLAILSSPPLPRRCRTPRLPLLYFSPSGAPGRALRALFGMSIRASSLSVL